ncbi:MAG: hypothetical protein ABSC19_02700 [Syntrophorhabdales bacterium]|jgi:hypothetical protein
MNNICENSMTSPSDPMEHGPDQGIGDLLRTYALDLRALNGYTEKDFLALGSSLYGISSRAEAVSRSTAAIVELVASDEIARDMEGVRELFDSMEGRFVRSRLDLDRRFTPLKRMSDMVKKAYGPLSVFHVVVKRLRMLGVSTRIESARLGRGDTGFEALAANVEQLSAMIASRSENVQLSGVGHPSRSLSNPLNTSPHTLPSAAGVSASCPGSSWPVPPT